MRTCARTRQRGALGLPRWLAFKCVRSIYFEISIMCVIIANIVVLMMDEPPMEGTLAAESDMPPEVRKR